MTATDKEHAAAAGAELADDKIAAANEAVVRALARVLVETGLTEIEIEQAGLRVRVARQAASVPATVAAPPAAEARYLTGADIPAAGTPVGTGTMEPAKHPGVVASPMVGTAYRAPEPGARAFVDIGSVVKEGEPILIIEAMKTMNQIPAPHGGTVTQILIEDGQPVEFGEPLMIIE